MTKSLNIDLLELDGKQVLGYVKLRLSGNGSSLNVLTNEKNL